MGIIEIARIEREGHVCIVAFSGWVRSKGTLTLQTGDKKRRPLNGIEGAMHGALEPSVG